jgi:hypothetical protein
MTDSRTRSVGQVRRHWPEHERTVPPRHQSGAPAGTVSDRVLALQRTAGNAAVTGLIGVPVQRGVGEAIEQIIGVGPLDTLTARDDAIEAREAAESSGLRGAIDGPQDAFRHALWNCLMTLSIGAAQARQVATTHEDQADTHPNVTAMDEHNNVWGRLLAKKAKDRSECRQLVMGALRSGDLLIIKNWRARSEARQAKQQLPPHGPLVVSNTVPDDVETGIRPLEAGTLDVAALNEKWRQKHEQKIIDVLKRPVRHGDDAGAQAKRKEVVALFRDFGSYWSATYRDRILAPSKDDELAQLLITRVSRHTRDDVIEVLTGKRPRRAGAKR